MRISFLFPACFFLLFCWMIGVEWNSTNIQAEKSAQERPYAEIMHEAVDELRQRNIAVDYPNHLPILRFCSDCLAKHESFGAYQTSTDEVVMPDNFDITTVEGRAILIHEYGHFVLTNAGMSAEKQEPLCLMLGNSVYQRAFSLAANQ